EGELSTSRMLCAPATRPANKEKTVNSFFMDSFVLDWKKSMWKVRGVLYRFLYRVHGILAYPIGVFHSLGIKKAGMWVHSGLFTLISDDYFNPTLSSLSRMSY